MDVTTNLNLPYISPAQAQKHVTHNEALRLIDSIVHLGFSTMGENMPPDDPADGERHFIGSAPVDAWSGHAGHIAVWQDGAWIFVTPQPGWIGVDLVQSILVIWTGSTWESVGGGTASLDNLAGVGIGTVHDSTTRLAVRSEAVSISHDEASANSGSAQLIINKQAPADTSSLLFQSGWIGHAEMGLTGSNVFELKVSSDGASWQQALVADPSDGSITFNTLRSAQARGARASSLLFTAGSVGVTSFYRNTLASGENPRTATIADITNDTITFTQPLAEGIFHESMNGVSMLRIWNTTRSANGHSAWAVENLSQNQIRVLESHDINDWMVGDIVKAGEPETVVPRRVMAFDISPMLTTMFGAPFRQTGLLTRSALDGGTDGDRLSLTADGSMGSFIDAATLPSSAGISMSACILPSPVSNSNLVFVRENIANVATQRALYSIAVMA